MKKRALVAITGIIVIFATTMLSQAGTHYVNAFGGLRDRQEKRENPEPKEKKAETSTVKKEEKTFYCKRNNCMKKVKKEGSYCQDHKKIIYNPDVLYYDDPEDFYEEFKDYYEDFDDAYDEWAEYWEN